MARGDDPAASAYLRSLPAPTRRQIDRVRGVIRKALPRAREGISYKILVYKIDDEMVLYLAGFAKHYAIYPATGRLLRELADQLDGRLHGRATLRFSLEEPVPVKLITRIAKIMAAQAVERHVAKLARKGTKSAPRAGKKATPAVASRATAKRKVGATTRRRPSR